MKRILNREVNVNGQIFEVGTDVETLPEGNRISVIDAGWTVEVDEPTALAEDETSRNALASGSEDPSSQTDTVPMAGPATDSVADPVQSAEPVADQTEPMAGPATTDNRPLSELGFEAAKLELLAANDPPITTVGQALDFVKVNKTFRTIAGFGKAADQELRQKLGVL